MKMKLSELRAVISEIMTELQEDGSAPSDTEWPSLQQMASGQFHPDKLVQMSKICPNRLWSKTASLVANALRLNPLVKQGDQNAKKEQDNYKKQIAITWQQFQESPDDHVKRAVQMHQKVVDKGMVRDPKDTQGNASTHVSMGDTYRVAGQLRGGSALKGNWG